MGEKVQLEESWRTPLAGMFETPLMADLRAWLVAERAAGRQIAPRPAHWFRALDLTPLPDVRVVILGQDPYHGPGQAHGLCFSVPHGVPVPPSLRNIQAELNADLGIAPPGHGNLESWARQGVLLLNSVLTVELGKAASHAGQGWERFTDEIIRLVSARPTPAVFILWGRYAQQKAGFVDGTRHLILKSAHPSPLSAYNGFFGSRPFSQANAFLQANGQRAVDWRVPISDPDQ